MTDREKIRAYIEKLHQEHRGSKGDSIFRNALRTVLFYIDSMQEEHKETKKECMYSKEFFTNKDRKVLCDGCEEDCKYNKKEPIAPKVLEDMLNAKPAAESFGISQEEHDRIVDELIYGKEPELVDVNDLPKEEPVSEIDFEQELYKAFGHVKDFTLCLKIARRFYDMGKNSQEPVSEELEKVVEEIVDPTVLNAYGTKELARRLRNTICGTSVSEDLEEAATDFAEGEWEGIHDNDGNPLYDQDYVEYSFKAGAQWQKEQMMKNAKEGILENDDFYGYVKLTGSRVDKEQENKEVKVIIILED